MTKHTTSKARWVALLVTMAVALATTAAVAGAQSGGSEKPKASEIGVTDKEIRIAVVADVDNAAAPGLFQGSVDAVRGFARFMNANGKLAGRNIVVDFIDSHLSNSDARNAVIQACQNDFAMVGTSALFLNNVDDQLACKDMAGAASGLPDLPFVSTEVAQQCSPDTYPMAPPQVICSTKDQHPQTYQASVGRGFYYKKKYGNLHGIYIFGSDVKAARNSTFASLGQLRAVCCKSDQDFDLSALAPQSAYTPVVQAMKNHSSNYGQSTSTFAGTIALRKEAKLQGITNQVKVWDCGTQCYDPKLLIQGGADVEGQYVDALYLPFLDAKEQKANKMAANFVKYTGKDKAAGLGGVYAWVAGIAFRDAVNAVVQKAGVNGLTRKALFEALNGIHDFDAEGMFGKIDLAGRKASPCHVLLQVQHGKLARVEPTKVGTFDCAKKNIVHVKLDLL